MCQTTAVSVRSLHKLAPPSALGSEGGTAEFSGPLLRNPGGPTTGVGLVRGGSTQVRNHRAKVTKYLDEGGGDGEGRSLFELIEGHGREWRVVVREVSLRLMVVWQEKRD